MQNNKLATKQQQAGLLLLSGARLTQALAPTVRAAVLAAQDESPAVVHLDPVVLQIGLIEALTAALFNLNHGSSYNDGPDDEPGRAVELLAGEVARMVQRRFPGFKPAEVQEAIRRGSSGDWHNAKDPLYLSVPTVQSWLTRYRDEARLAAAEAIRQADEDFTRDGEPTVLDFPAWHLQSIRLNLPHLLGLVQQCLGPKGYQPNDLQTIAWGGILYDWLETLGVLGGFCPKEERQAMYAAECERLAKLPVTTLGDGLARKSEINDFATLWAEQSPRLGAHSVAREARANCRRALLRAWLESWPSLRDVEAYVVGAWASAYFTYYQTATTPDWALAHYRKLKRWVSK